MNKIEFDEKYCKMCGTQRCGGVDDKEFREGCIHYEREFLNKNEAKRK